MFGILVSAFNVVLGFVLRSVIGKFFLFFGLYFVTTEFVPVLLGMLPDAAGVQTAFSTLPPGMAYFLRVFGIPQCLTMVLSAYVTRFIIRRIPLIG